MKSIRKLLVALFVSGSVLAAYVLPALADGGD
jgi:hypothetical protein